MEKKLNYNIPCSKIIKPGFDIMELGDTSVFPGLKKTNAKKAQDFDEWEDECPCWEKEGKDEDVFGTPNT